MTRVRVAEFKAHLSRHLRSVRKGRRLVILDRETPIAEVVPIGPEPRDALSVREPRRPLKGWKPLPPLRANDGKPIDSLTFLLEMRRNDR